jgi:hypothetical protein
MQSGDGCDEVQADGIPANMYGRELAIHKRTDSGTEGSIPAECRDVGLLHCVTCGAQAGHMMTTPILEIDEEIVGVSIYGMFL